MHRNQTTLRIGLFALLTILAPRAALGETEAHDDAREAETSPGIEEKATELLPPPSREPPPAVPEYGKPPLVGGAEAPAGTFPSLGDATLPLASVHGTVELPPLPLRAMEKTQWQKWIADLDSDSYEVRVKAHRLMRGRLIDLDTQKSPRAFYAVLPLLIEAYETTKSPEQRLRLRRILRASPYVHLD